MGRLTAKTVASFAALALLLAGCGSSDDESLTKAEFIKQGDKICEEANQEIVADYKDFAKSNDIKKLPSQGQTTEIAEAVYVPSMEKRLGELQELSPPEADQDEVEKIFVSMEDAIATAKEDPAAVLQVGSPFEEPGDLARKYGLKVCGAT